MHELGLCMAVVEAVERRAGDRPVARVVVRVGCRHHVHPEAFDQSFRLAAAGGSAEGATADVVVTPQDGKCPACGALFSTLEPAVEACPACGAPGVETCGGDEVILESIEYAGAERG